MSAVKSSERRIASGAIGEVRLIGVGAWVPFEVGTVNPDERRWNWEVARVAATGHRVRGRPEGCRVEFEMPLAAGGYAPVCRRACRNLRLLAEE